MHQTTSARFGTLRSMLHLLPLGRSSQKHIRQAPRTTASRRASSVKHVFMRIIFHLFENFWLSFVFPELKYFDKQSENTHFVRVLRPNPEPECLFLRPFWITKFFFRTRPNRGQQGYINVLERASSVDHTHKAPTNRQSAPQKQLYRYSNSSEPRMQPPTAARMWARSRRPGYALARAPIDMARGGVSWRRRAKHQTYS